MVRRFHHLNPGLSVVLVFVGAKMLLIDIFEVPVGLSLGVIAPVLTASVLASLAWPKAVEAHDPVIHDPLERKPPDPVSSPPLETRNRSSAL